MIAGLLLGGCAESLAVRPAEPLRGQTSIQQDADERVCESLAGEDDQRALRYTACLLGRGYRTWLGLNDPKGGGVSMGRALVGAGMSHPGVMVTPRPEHEAPEVALGTCLTQAWEGREAAEYIPGMYGSSVTPPIERKLAACLKPRGFDVQRWEAPR